MKLRLTWLVLLMTPLSLFSQVAPLGIDRVIDVMINREHLFMESVSHLSPMAEVYIQNTDSPELSFEKGQYFLGRMEVRNDGRLRAHKLRSSGRPVRFLDLLTGSMQFNPEGFMAGFLLDSKNFDREHYYFQFVGMENLGQTRCYVFSVIQKGKRGFTGQIWVENSEYNIVRSRGVHVDKKMLQFDFHTECWRQHARPGLWLPAIIISEEQNMRYTFMRSLNMKAITTFWDFGPAAPRPENNEIIIDGSDVSDLAKNDADNSRASTLPERLERAGLLAPQGAVEFRLNSLVKELGGKSLDCRILLTNPPEIFRTGSTLILSRGLVQSADELTIAILLAFQLARIDSPFKFVDAQQLSSRTLNILHNSRFAQGANRIISLAETADVKNHFGRELEKWDDQLVLRKLPNSLRLPSSPASGFAGAVNVWTNELGMPAESARVLTEPTMSSRLGR